MRGLKLPYECLSLTAPVVAPYVGAWIETGVCRLHLHPADVAPYVGAWIETRLIITSVVEVLVAPYVGAWIETQYSQEKPP